MITTPAPPPRWHLDPSKKRVIGYDSSLSERVVMSSPGKLKLVNCSPGKGASASWSAIVCPLIDFWCINSRS
ncbi:hypothetical protein KI387_007572, partial [Taxus chinensis]